MTIKKGSTSPLWSTYKQILEDAENIKRKRPENINRKRPVYFDKFYIKKVKLPNLKTLKKCEEAFLYYNSGGTSSIILETEVWQQWEVKFAHYSLHMIRFLVICQYFPSIYSLARNKDLVSRLASLTSGLLSEPFHVPELKIFQVSQGEIKFSKTWQKSHPTHHRRN